MTDTIKAFLEADEPLWCVSDIKEAIRIMMERLQKLEAEHNSALADIEMARDVFQYYVDNCADDIKAKQALSALDKYKGGV